MNQKELEGNLKQVEPILAPRIILWVTYLKGTSKIKTDINREAIRNYAKPLGLIGVFTFPVSDD